MQHSTYTYENPQYHSHKAFFPGIEVTATYTGYDDETTVSGSIENALMNVYDAPLWKDGRPVQLQRLYNDT